MPTTSSNVRVRGQSGKHVLALSFSGFDTERTWTLLKRKDGLSVVLHADHPPAFFLCFIVERLREGAELAVGQTRCRAISVLSRSVVMQPQHFQPRSSASGGPLQHLLVTDRVSERGIRSSANHQVDARRLPSAVVVEQQPWLLDQERLAIFVVAEFRSTH